MEKDTIVFILYVLSVIFSAAVLLSVDIYEHLKEKKHINADVWVIIFLVSLIPCLNIVVVVSMGLKYVLKKIEKLLNNMIGPEE